MRDRVSGQSKRMVFVEFFETEYAQEALTALNGTQLPYGETLKIRFASPRTPQPRTGGYRGAGSY